VVVTSRGRWARPLLVGTAIALGLVVVFHLAGGWYFSNVLYDSALDAEARRAELERDFTVEVLALGDGAITLEAGEGGDQRRPGVWGIAWPDGYGIAGDIRDEGPDRVTRAFSLMTGTAPAPGDLVDVDAKAFPDAPVDALGVAPEVVQVPGPLGDHESWFFGGTRPTWVLLLHGNTPNRLDMAKLLPRLREEGYPALLVSLRNDPGAPPDPSGMFRYGETEWADLEAAVRHAVDRGADDVVLVGPSMGGGVVMSFLQRSPLAALVRAVALDAPMLDFSRTVDFQAADESLPVVGLPLPATLTATAKWIVGWRFDLDWDELDYLRSTNELETPILVFHGSEDGDIPLATSRDLAAARPDLVTLQEVPRAGHLGTWNVDPVAYEERFVDFLEEHAD
jgi:pimeloyl-ACP methyl ester carboxylesterase